MILDSTQLLATLRTEPAPVSFARLKKAHVNKKAGILEAHLRAALDSALASRDIFAWPKNRYWHIDPESQLQTQILTQCAARACKKADIKVKGRTAKDIAAAVNRLLASQRLLQYPALAGTSKLFVSAGSPQAYWAYVQAFVSAKLKKAGIPEEAESAEAESAEAESAEDSLEEKICDILPKLEPEKDVPVSTSRLRRALGLSETGKRQFDEAALKLREQRRVYLSQHDHPLGLSPEERDWLIDGQDGRYYVAITRRES